MEFVTRVASSVVGKVLEYPIRLIGRHLGYLIYYQTNIKSLTDQQPELDNKISSVQRRAQADQRNGKELEECVTGWIREAKRKVEEAKDVINDRGHENAKCSCNGSFPNLVSRYKLSKKAKIMAENIVSVLQKADNFGNFSYLPLIQPSFKNKDYVAFGTRKKTLKKIMEALKDPDLSMIGVYGMGGVGKTTLIKEVARQAKKEECFSEVIMVTVSQDVDLKSIQNRIAEGLDIKLEGENMLVRASRLQHRLRQGNNILIILDDIWNELDLSEAGIYFNDDDQRECKILLVSRDHDVLHSLMIVRKNIEVKVLSNSESMSLFYKYVGNKADDPDFKTLANQVVGECGGLPIAITTVARSLENKSLLVWKDTLRQLKRSPKRGVYEKVYSCIKTSYDFLESEEKKLLLLCSLHGEDADVRVDDLMIYGIGWDLFEEVGTMEEARCRVHSLVHKLKARCLLLGGNYEARVRMHDVIRDVMISVAKEDEHMRCFTKVAEFEECLHKEDFREYSKAIILLGPDFNNQLLPRLVCPKLQLLLAFDKHYYLSLGTIPDDFFKEAQELKALTFSCMPLQSLPQSFCTLRHLRALRLRLGEKADLTLIGELMYLIVLDLSKSEFNLLPEQIGKLTRLQSLNLSYCNRLRVIQPNVISSLVRLEELYMDGVDIDWEVEGRVGEGRNASLMELKNLWNLTTLHLNVRDANVLPKDMFSENLQRYRIKINGSFFSYPDFTGSRFLYLNLRESSQVYQYGIQKLMKNSEELWLVEFHGVDNIVFELDGFPQLKNFHLKNNEVQYIVHSAKEIQPCSAFPNLKTLNLENLRNLEKICYGNVAMESFGKLRRINVRNCDKLKNLFSFSIARKLEEINVSKCKMMEMLVYHGSEDAAHGNINNEAISEKLEFPQLRSLNLNSLSNLVFFWSGLETTCGSSLSDSPQPLFGEKVVFPSLKKLGLSRMNFRELCSTTSCMQNLSSLDVSSCPNLKYLFTVAMAGGLPQLETLKIRGCHVMEEVVVTNEHGEGRLEKDSFPKLKYLMIEDLPNLRRFCTGDCIECPSLLNLEIENCGVLRKFISSNEEEIEGPFFNEKVVFPSLKKLGLSGMNFRELWSTTSCMQKYLSSLDVSSCPNLKYLFTVAMAGGLPQLETLKIRGCHVMEEVVVTNEHGEGRLEKDPFHKLKYLTLEDLPNLRRFCTGDCIEWPSLLKLEIKNCGVLRKFISSNEEEIEGPFFNEKVVFPSLEELYLSGMNFRELWSTTSCMQKYLSSLDVSSCPNLKYLFTVAMAGGLPQLETLKIRGCHVMEEVVVTNEHGEGRLEKDPFHKLQYLTLEDLPNLRRFCTGDCIEWPSLLKLEIKKCGVLRKFISSNEEEVEGPFFNEKVSFPILEYLRLQEVNLKILWADQLSITSFGMHNLKELYIEDCDILSHLFSLDVARSLLQLEELHLSYCKGTEAVLVTKEPIEEGTPQKMSFPNLKNLQLWNLQNIRRFCAGCCSEFPSLTKTEIARNPAISTFITDSCNKASGELMGSEAKQPLFNGTVAFPKLEALDVGGLNSVNSLFSFAVAKSLVTLKELEVWRCSLMEEIVQVNEQGEEGRLDKISFPKLESIHFNGLSNLKRFYGGARIDFPSLLKSKITAGKETEEIMDRVVLGPNLEELTTTSSKSMLTHLYEDSECFENSSLESLKYLLIRDCDRVNSPLSSSTTSFQNLMALVVSECSSMINLLASSTAKTLVHLRLMSITECKQMTEIIADEIVDEEIVFGKLEILELSDLPSLRSFHSAGNSVMRFPNLVRLVVSQCPEMRRFSFGTMDAPKLDSISGKKVMNKLGSLPSGIHFDNWMLLLREPQLDNWMLHLREPQQKLWEGDINKTLKKLWEEDYSLVMQRLFTET